MSSDMIWNMNMSSLRNKKDASQVEPETRLQSQPTPLVRFAILL